MLSKAAIRLAHRLLRDAIIRPHQKPLRELMDANFPIAEDFFRGEGIHAYIHKNHRRSFEEKLRAAEATKQTDTPHDAEDDNDSR